MLHFTPTALTTFCNLAVALLMPLPLPIVFAIPREAMNRFRRLLTSTFQQTTGVANFMWYSHMLGS